MKTSGSRSASTRALVLRAAFVLGVLVALRLLWSQYTYVSEQQAQLMERARRHRIRDGPRRIRNPVSTSSATPAQQQVWETERPRVFKAASREEQEQRRLAVRSAMQFAWSNYEEHAFGADELAPITGVAKHDVWGNIACSLVDGLDTLWIMGLKEEFARARDYVGNKLSFEHLGQNGAFLSVFETTIREVGGLLSAFELSGDPVFKTKAQELVEILIPAYSQELGVFYSQYNPHTKQRKFPVPSGGGGALRQQSLGTPSRGSIADMGTLQLELRYLSDVTGDPKYAKMGDSFYEVIQREGSFNGTGLFPVYYEAEHKRFARLNRITLGGLGDSFYEYLLKVFVYSGQQPEDKFLRKLYDDAVDGIEANLLVYSEYDKLTFMQQLRLPTKTEMQRMDHLACFVPGMLALGTIYEKKDLAKNERHMGMARNLTETCYQMYHRMPMGLSPDSIAFPSLRSYDRQHKLRPEVVESLFYMYRITKDVKYREYGWDIFLALDKHARTNNGYGALFDVTELPALVENKMESFFLAETLKYHYLLQTDEELIPLDEFVFNTEAHPLRIRKDRGQ